VWGLASSTPSFARRRLAQMLRTRSPKDWDVLLERAGRFVPPLRARTPGDKVHKLASLVETSSVDDLYDRLTSIWWSPSEVVRGGHEKRVVRPGLAAGVAEQFMLRDLVGYLHDDVLTKVDRASMSVGLEVRVPLLDHRLVELAWRLPTDVRVGSTGKDVLRRVLRRHVPDALFNRPKMGFGVPIDVWLRGPLREWAESLLDPRRLRDDGFLDGSVVADLWQRHLGGKGAVQHQVWSVLMFQAWREKWL
jgi:asparagine synthase (glutamine-hydrolysing)